MNCESVVQAVRTVWAGNRGVGTEGTEAKGLLRKQRRLGHLGCRTETRKLQLRGPGEEEVRQVFWGHRTWDSWGFGEAALRGLAPLEIQGEP